MSTSKDTTTKDYALFLGGSSKKHRYLHKYFQQYGSSDIESTSLRTKDCHKYGPERLRDYFKQQNMRIVAVCPLMDSLVPFTDAMNAHWNLPHNDTATSQQRRNKALMHERLSTADTLVRHGRYFTVDKYVTDEQPFSQRIHDAGLAYPVVVKPPTSGGTDGVRLCHSFEACQRVIRAHLFRENGESHRNTQMMVQEFLDGEEFVVNTCSYQGQHRISDVWRAYKGFRVDTIVRRNKGENEKGNDQDDSVAVIAKEEDDDTKHDLPTVTSSSSAELDAKKGFPYSMLYDYQQFESRISGNPKLEMVVRYVLTVLDRLGIRYGCGHCEVMYLPAENKVCLIELNARMHGGLPRATGLVGYDQMTLLALQHCDAHSFVHKIPQVYDTKQRGKFKHLLHGNEQQTLRSSDQEDADVDGKNDDENVTVRAVFLRSDIDGRLNVPLLIEVVAKLQTFKMFARSLFDVVEYWKRYTQAIKSYEQQLELIALVRQTQKQQNQEDGAVEEIDALNTTEIEQSMNKALDVIERIEAVEKTIDLISCPGTVVLQGRIDDIEKDYRQIRALEEDHQNGLFLN